MSDTLPAHDPEPGDDGAAAGAPARRPEPGLYLVATPIGAARDITLRALDLLAAGDVLAAEDTRTLRHLMAIHGVPLRGRRIVAYHEHNEAEAGAALLEALRQGRVVVYASEAGTPLVSDPGFRLVRDAAAAGIEVRAAPGPSAVLAALTVSGLPSDRFLFAGFAPAAAAARRRWLAEVMAVDATAILFESPRRVRQLFNDLCEIDEGRNTVICRELTKRFEEVRRGTAAELRDSGLEGLKGELVVLIDRAPPHATAIDAVAAIDAALAAGLSVRDAAAQVAAAGGGPRREVYRLALERARRKGDEDAKDGAEGDG